MVADLLLAVLIALTAAVAGTIEIMTSMRFLRDPSERNRPGRLILW